MIFLIFIVSMLLSYFIGRFQISKIKINNFILFIWLSIIIYVTLIFSSPYVLFSLFLSIILMKLFVESEMWSTMIKYSIYISIFIFIFNIILNNNGESIIWEWYFLRISLESITFSISMILRLIIIMGAFAIFNSNVEMEDIITILEKLRLPHKAIMSASISLRFFPIMLKEAKDITDLFKIRGIPVYSGTMKDKIMSRYPIMASMLNISLERAIQIGEALETKGYPSSKRKAWKIINLYVWQKISLSILILTAVIGSLYVITFGNYSFYPSLQPVSMKDYCLSFVIFAMPLSVFIGRVRKYDN